MTKTVWIILFFLQPLKLVYAQSDNVGKQKSYSVYIDKKGIIRWNNGEELALFGANYSLPSACDYRAAKRVTTDLKYSSIMIWLTLPAWDGMECGFVFGAISKIAISMVI